MWNWKLAERFRRVQRFKAKEINKEGVAILYRSKHQCKQSHMGLAGLHHMCLTIIDKITWDPQGFTYNWNWQSHMGFIELPHMQLELDAIGYILTITLSLQEWDSPNLIVDKIW